MATISYSPTGTGSISEWSGTTPRYEQVDDSTSPTGHDSATTVITCGGGTFGRSDSELFTFTNTIASGSTINSVTVNFVMQQDSTTNSPDVKGTLYLSGSQSYGTAETASSWTNKSQTISRPGGGSWSYSDLANLEFGVHSDDDGKIGNNTDVTQVYITIDYSSGGTAYSLSCDSGSFALTGSSVSFPIARKVTAGSGSFVLTGSDASLYEDSSYPPPTSLECDRQTNPTNIGEHPVFTSIYHTKPGDGNGVYYQIRVAKDPTYASGLAWATSWTAFNTQVTDGSRCEEIEYAGSNLESGETYYWSIKMVGSTGTGNWSENATFTMSVRDWRDANYPLRYKLNFGNSHRAISAGELLKLNLQTGNRIVVATNGYIDEAIQPGGHAIVRFGDKTHIAYLSGIDTDDGYAKIYVVTIDHSTGEVGTPKFVDISDSYTPTDTHYYPEIEATPDGYLHIFYGCHYTQLKYRRSKYVNESGSLSTDHTDSVMWVDPNDGSDDYVAVTGATNATYPISFYVEDNSLDLDYRLYVFWRHGDFSTAYQNKYSYSDDGGKTWSSAHTFINDTYYVDADNQHYRVYVFGLAYDYDKKRLHIIFTHNHKVGGVVDVPMGVWYAYSDYDATRSGSSLTDGFNVWRWADGRYVDYPAISGTCEIDYSESDAVVLSADELSVDFIIELVLLNDGAPVLFYEQKFDKTYEGYSYATLATWETHICNAKWEKSVPITQFSDYGGTPNKVNVYAASHGREVGDKVVISGTTNYDGEYYVQSETTNVFTIIHSWEGDDATGTMTSYEIGRSGSWNIYYLSDQINTLQRVRRSGCSTAVDRDNKIHAYFPVSPKTSFGCVPTADVDFTAATNNSHTGVGNYTLVDDGFTHIDQDTYVGVHGTSGQLTFSHSTTPPEGITKIYKVEVVLYAKRATSNTVSLKAVISDGTTDDTHTTTETIDNDDIHEFVWKWTQNPFTSADWDSSDIADLEFGFAPATSTYDSYIYNCYLRVTYTKVSNEQQMASELVEANSTDGGKTWTVKEISYNSMYGTPMIGRKHIPTAGAIEICWTSGPDIVYLIDEPFGLMLPSGKDVRIYWNDTEIDRVANYWNLNESTIYFQAQEAIDANDPYGSKDYFIEFGNKNETTAAKGDPTNVWQGFWNWEQLDPDDTSNDNLTDHPDWNAVSNNWVVYSSLEQHRNKVFSGLQSVQTSSSTGEAYTTIGSGLQDIIIESAIWQETSTDHSWIGVRDSSGNEFRVGINALGKTADYYNGTWNSSTVVVRRSSYNIFKIVVTSSGCSAWVNGAKFVTDDTVLNTADQIRVGYDAKDSYLDYIRWTYYDPEDITITLDSLEKRGFYMDANLLASSTLQIDMDCNTNAYWYEHSYSVPIEYQSRTSVEEKSPFDYLQSTSQYYNIPFNYSGWLQHSSKTPIEYLGGVENSSLIPVGYISETSFTKKAPIDFQESIYLNKRIAIDYIAGLELQQNLPFSYKEGLSSQKGIPFDYSGYLQHGFSIPVDFLREVQSSEAIPIDYLVDYSMTHNIPFGYLARAVIRNNLPLDYSAVNSFTNTIPIDFKQTVSDLKGITPIDFQSESYLKHTIPILYSKGIESKGKLPFEWLSTVVEIMRGALPIDWSGGVYFSQRIPSDYIGSLSTTKYVSIDYLMEILKEYNVPIEYGFYSSVNTYGLPIDFGLSKSSKNNIPIETQKGLESISNLSIDYIQGVGFVIRIPFGWQGTSQKIMSGGIPIDWTKEINIVKNVPITILQNIARTTKFTVDFSEKISAENVIPFGYTLVMQVTMNLISGYLKGIDYVGNIIVDYIGEESYSANINIDFGGQTSFSGKINIDYLTQIITEAGLPIDYTGYAVTILALADISMLLPKLSGTEHSTPKLDNLINSCPTISNAVHSCPELKNALIKIARIYNIDVD